MVVLSLRGALPVRGRAIALLAGACRAPLCSLHVFPASIVLCVHCIGFMRLAGPAVCVVRPRSHITGRSGLRPHRRAPAGLSPHRGQMAFAVGFGRKAGKPWFLGGQHHADGAVGASSSPWRLISPPPCVFAPPLLWAHMGPQRHRHQPHGLIKHTPGSAYVSPNPPLRNYCAFGQRTRAES